jgi:SseB protein N-terminal domain
MVTAALAAFAAGTGTEQAALMALAQARLLVPVVAVLADDLDEGNEPVRVARGEKASDMAMPVIVGTDGRPALPAFTSLETLHGWQPGARPVPVPAEGVWRSAVEESNAVIIDIAGPVPLAVEGARLAALAAGAQVPAMHDDPDVWQLAAAAAAQVAPGIRVRLTAPERGLDFTLELAPPEGVAEPVSDDVANRIAEALTGLLAGRARSGIAVLRGPSRY